MDCFLIIELSVYRLHAFPWRVARCPVDIGYAMTAAKRKRCRRKATDEVSLCKFEDFGNDFINGHVGGVDKDGVVCLL